MSQHSERIAVRFILAATFLLFLTYSLATPLFEASDELWHYPLVQHIATTGSLPVQHQNQSDADAPWRQEGSQPPLYYVAAALASAPFDSANWRDIRRLNPHGDLGRPTTDGNQNAVLHSSAELFPWTSAALAVHVARLISVIFSTLTVFFSWLVGTELFPRLPIRSANRLGNGDGDTRLTTSVSPDSGVDDRAWLRLAAMILTACVPMFAFISGSVNNDNAAAMFATLGLWVALRLARCGQISVTTGLIAGTITACAALSKSSTLGLLGLFGLAGIFACVRLLSNSPRPRTLTLLRDFTVFLLAMLFTTSILAGWWFIRNQQLYGDWLGWNAFLDAVGHRDPPASMLQLWSEREGFIWSYWGVFGTLNVVMPHFVYDLLNGVVLFAIVGWISASIRTIFRRPQKPVDESPARIRLLENLTRGGPVFICLIWTAVTFIALLRWTSLTPASQGRLMFPCIAVLSSAIAYGCYRLHKIVLGVAVTGFVLLAIAVPFMFIEPIYATPPELSDAKPANLLSTTFGGALDLIGFESQPEVIGSGEIASVRLYWRNRTTLSRNYSVYVHLLNQDNVVIGQRDMYPGQGSLATSELKPGYSWMDHYDVQLSALVIAPQNLHWAVGLYDLQTGERLSVTAGRATEEGVELGALSFVPSQDTTRTLLNYGNGIILRHYELSSPTLHAGQPVSVTLNWSAESKVAEDLIVSVQLIDENTNKIAQHDAAPVRGNSPTSTWVAGQKIDDNHVLRIATDARPGVYRLQLVLYRPGDFSRIGAYGADGIYLGNEITLMQVRVK